MGIRIQSEGSGGFSVTPELQEDLVRFFKEGGHISGDGWVKGKEAVTTYTEEDSMREFVQTESNENVRMSLVTSWSWDSEEINHHLTAADIMSVTLYLNTSDGHQHTVDDPEQLAIYGSFVEEDSHKMFQSDFNYYVQNLWTYDKQCKIAEERDKKETA